MSKTYCVMYRGVNSERLRKTYNIGKYITITTEFSGNKEYCIKKAREMNNHVKKFNHEKYGLNVYFVREVIEK